MSPLSSPKQFLSTLSLRRATVPLSHTAGVSKISIHALLAESDAGKAMEQDGLQTISIHALLAESDHVHAHHIVHKDKFLSTLSLRRATAIKSLYSCWFPFLSTLSLRRATPAHGCIGSADNISIHALLAESDVCARLYITPSRNFYPRSPCGERPWAACAPSNIGSDFYPRSPCGERPARVGVAGGCVISIHALLAESDLRCSSASQNHLGFLSTLSLRRATLMKSS